LIDIGKIKWDHWEKINMYFIRVESGYK